MRDDGDRNAAPFSLKADLRGQDEIVDRFPAATPIGFRRSTPATVSTWNRIVPRGPVIAVIPSVGSRNLALSARIDGTRRGTRRNETVVSSSASSCDTRFSRQRSNDTNHAERCGLLRRTTHRFVFQRAHTIYKTYTDDVVILLRANTPDTISPFGDRFHCSGCIGFTPTTVVLKRK